MMVISFLLVVITALTAATMVTADTEVTCGNGSKCSSDVPCCSQYGQCGTGANCLGGCDPVNSFSLNSCTPAPICESKTFTSWKNTDDIAQNYVYLGNASDTNWWVSGTVLVYDDSLLLTLAENTTGTLLAYNHYVWYGRISVTMKTSRGAGVVTAFVMMSDVKDEIDVEFIGVDLRTTQLNYFFQGIETGMLEVNATISSDSFENFHTYEIDWTPDVLTWYVDGVSVRTLARNTTYNSTTNSYWYPQTPSRVELSVWPGGSPSEPQGTIDWAGGEIQWDTADIKDPGYYYATIGEISITCYDPPTGVNVQGSKSYIYTDATGTNNTVEITDENTVLGSFEATGTNVTAGATTTSASQASSSTGGSDTSSDSGSSNASGASSSSNSSSGFVQGTNSTGMSSSIAVNHPLAQSLLALVVTLLAF